MKIEKRTVPSKKGNIQLFRLTNGTGASLELSSLGAGIVSVEVPNREGKMTDVVLGYNNPTDYLSDGPCAGKTPGRFANRIAQGQFTLDGVRYQLHLNEGRAHQLHGGDEGFMNQLWEATEMADGILFAYRSNDGEMGYPGNLEAYVHYTFLDSNEIKIELSATTDKPTIVNLTNHTYFNLNGHASGSMIRHQLQLNASQYLLTDQDLIPTGELAPVEGTPMDFRSPKAIGQEMSQAFPALQYGKGYDSCWAIDNWDGTIRKAATLRADESGIVLEVSTDQPGIQVYGGNWLNGSPKGKDGKDYADYDCVALECQGYPDAPNHANFPNQTLRPGEQYLRHINFRFTTD